jgi:hypothetical protein
MSLTLEAEEWWRKHYARLSKSKPGLFGEITGRAEPQVMRIALVHALLDKSETIDRHHLEAANTLWAYCEASAQYVFGDATGNPLADSLLRILRRAGSAGMGRKEIHLALGSNVHASKISAALALLANWGNARCVDQPGRGRSIERWFANGGEKGVLDSETKNTPADETKNTPDETKNTPDETKNTPSGTSASPDSREEKGVPGYETKNTPADETKNTLADETKNAPSDTSETKNVHVVKKRGRPPTGKAMTGAERLRKHRVTRLSRREK